MTADMEKHFALIDSFLIALGQRDLEKAGEILHPEFLLTVSGGHEFASLTQFAAFSKSRNGPTVKQRLRYEGFETPTGSVVFSIGTMSGSWLDGSQFEGVRYIDRFEILQSRIRTMDVWSDMAEFRPAAPVPPG